MRVLTRILFTILFITPAAFAHEQGADHDHAGKSRVEIIVRDGYRYIRANGMPNHKHGEFPNRRNPNAMREQSYRFRVPVKPKPADKPIEIQRQLFGVAINGVPFDPGTAEYFNRDRESGWRYEALSGKIDLGLDEHQAHVQPNGAYHYHGLPTALIAPLKKKAKMLLIGYAADGFPIYAMYGYKDANDPDSGVSKLRSSYQLRKGARPDGPGAPGGIYDGTFVQDYEYVDGSGDLDECNGRTGVTPEYPDGTYYYVITETYPFVSRYYRGEPDESFSRRRPEGGPPGARPGRPDGPPPRRGDRPPPPRP